MQERFREMLRAQMIPWIEAEGSIAERTAACAVALEHVEDVEDRILIGSPGA